MVEGTKVQICLLENLPNKSNHLHENFISLSILTIICYTIYLLGPGIFILKRMHNLKLRLILDRSRGYTQIALILGHTLAQQRHKA